MDRLPKPNKLDIWLAKFPLSPNMKVFVTTTVVIGTLGYFFFRENKNKSGHNLLDTERPEAVFKAQDDAEKRKISNGINPK